MSSTPEGGSNDEHDESVQYSGSKSTGWVILVASVVSIAVIVVIFLLVRLADHMAKATPAQAHVDECPNPCRSPDFACHPASRRDDKGCFQPGCACYPEHCPKRCPPDHECVLGSKVDRHGCFLPNCRCAPHGSISWGHNCTSFCPPGEKCNADAALDIQGCPLPDCVCEPDCAPRCPVGQRCGPRSPVDVNGCFRPGCRCEPDCMRRCPEGLECTPNSARDLHGCFLAGCVCGPANREADGHVPECVSPCPFGKRCTENSTKDEKGCFLRGCTCEVECTARCLPGLRCPPSSPKDIDGCFLAGCACEPIHPEPTEGNSSRYDASTKESVWASGGDPMFPIGADTDNASLLLTKVHILIPGGVNRTTHEPPARPTDTLPLTPVVERDPGAIDNASFPDASSVFPNNSSADGQRSYNTSRAGEDKSENGDEADSNNGSSVLTQEPSTLLKNQQATHPANEGNAPMSSPAVVTKREGLNTSSAGTTADVGSLTDVSGDASNPLNFDVHDDGGDDESADDSGPSKLGDQTTADVGKRTAEEAGSSNSRVNNRTTGMDVLHEALPTGLATSKPNDEPRSGAAAASEQPRSNDSETSFTATAKPAVLPEND